MRREESIEQRAYVQWAEVVRVPWLAEPIGRHLFAVPNGGGRSKVEAAILKAEGVRPGVPDLMLALPTGHYHGLFLEMKRQNGGRVSPEQKAWIERLESVCYKAAVCRGFNEARLVTLEYLGMPA